jgi:LysM repeat protein
MFRRIFLLSFIFLLIFSTYGQKKDQQKIDYINNYKEIAISKMRKFGIPASITLAQGILESNSGNSELALKANNHFGIKCTSDWNGKVFHQDDDKPDECFRKYEKAEDSFDDHSIFLQRDRYKSLYSIPVTDYTGWARGLKKAGYATNPQYAELLIRIIEDYQLFLLDSEEYALFSESLDAKLKQADLKQNDKREKVKPAKDKVVKKDPDQIYLGYTTRKIQQINGVDYILARKGDDIESLTNEFDLFRWQIRKFNDLAKNQQIEPGQVIFIKAKKRNGDVAFHTVKTGETMQSISQLHGMKMKSLYRYNNMEKGTEPKAGQKLNLKSK